VFAFSTGRRQEFATTPSGYGPRPGGYPEPPWPVSRLRLRTRRFSVPAGRWPPPSAKCPAQCPVALPVGVAGPPGTWPGGRPSRGYPCAWRWPCAPRLVAESALISRSRPRPVDLVRGPRSPRRGRCSADSSWVDAIQLVRSTLAAPGRCRRLTEAVRSAPARSGLAFHPGLGGASGRHRRHLLGDCCRVIVARQDRSKALLRVFVLLALVRSEPRDVLRFAFSDWLSKGASPLPPGRCRYRLRGIPRLSGRTSRLRVTPLVPSSSRVAAAPGGSAVPPSSWPSPSGGRRTARQLAGRCPDPPACPGAERRSSTS